MEAAYSEAVFGGEGEDIAGKRTGGHVQPRQLMSKVQVMEQTKWPFIHSDKDAARAARRAATRGQGSR